MGNQAGIAHNQPSVANMHGLMENTHKISDASSEIQEGKRFPFGKNWARFLETLDDERIAEAVLSLQKMLDTDDLKGKRFLDIGSGSGLFSLAARKLGAQVESFDFDPQSVGCTNHLRNRYFPGDRNWTVKQASVLDAAFLSSLEKADIVYSWGVLHHTGSMWEALDNAARLVKDDGKLFIAIYNDQGAGSARWGMVKKMYNRHKILRPLILAGGVARLWGPAAIRGVIKGKPLDSIDRYKQYKKKSRGMSPWYDAVDWIGGWPFEYATPGAIFDFYKGRGFTLSKLVTRPGHGCNEFVFVKS